MKFLYKILFIVALLVPSVAKAQFYVTGDDPGKLKWNYIDTDNFRVIYPQGADSLARVYAFELEKYKVPVSRGTGYMAGHGDGRLMPAVLHAYNGANGSVAWAPKRMDLFTLPSAYEPEPVPWSTMLAIHEGRHVTQMQFGMTNNQRYFGYAFGQMWNILVSMLYPGMFLIEGDAVMTETAMTPSGRGRTADFLNYYRVAFDHGDFRPWDKWLFTSHKRYTPDHYSLGYLSFATIRYLYDYPELMKDTYDMASRKLFNFSPAMAQIKKNKTGVKYQETFREACDTMHAIWTRDAQARAPFIYAEEVSKKSSVYTNYSHTAAVGNDIYTVKNGFKNTPTLVRIDENGKEKALRSMSHEMSDLAASNGILYWSEEVPDIRWSMKSDSKIRSYNTETGKKTPRRVNFCEGEEGPVYNPSVSEDSRFAGAQYLYKGGSALWIDQSYPAPDSLQLVETAWIGKTAYATAISYNGFGIYAFDNETWTVVLKPQPVKITDFKAHGDKLMFTCDRTGVNELYHLDPVSGELTQKTVTKYGAKDFAYTADGRYLYYSAPTINGMRVFRTPVDSLIDRKADYTEKYKYVVADRLAEQENELARKAGYESAVDKDLKMEDVNISEPKRYRKASHLFNIHSWTPVYVSVDNIMNMSFDHIFQAASLGASVLMQNRLATGVGEFGYSAHKDPYDKSVWRHSGHFKFTYSGLYPVFEAKFDINDRAARQYSVKAVKRGEAASIGLYSDQLATPYIEGRLSTYIPFNFSSGGWSKGFIPRLSYRISNDMFNTSITMLEQNGGAEEMYPGNPPFTGVIDGKNRFRHSLTGSVRGYATLYTANSAAFPRWGIGGELGASVNIESSNILAPMGYAYLYGYVPGFKREQGVKLSVMHQQKLDNESIFGLPLVDVLPRGLSKNSELANYMSIHNSAITKVTADYTIPIYIGDLSIAGGFIYVKRLRLTPHVDYTRAGSTNLLSVGSALTLDLSGLIWIGWPVSVGATYSYNGLGDYNLVKSQTGLDMDLNHVGFVFNVSF